MSHFRVAAFTVALAAFTLTACDCGTPPVQGDGGTGGGDATGGGAGGSGGNGGNGGGGGRTVDPLDPNNPNKDTDCDGLNDAEEFGTTYAGGKRTNPANPDSDGDGIPDGIEMGRTTSVDPLCASFVGDADPTTRTLPTEIDSDADALPDGLEDTNKNGKLDPGETDASQPDTDRDGLIDGAEDANHDGVVDATETDPRKKDTDGDFINDGIEKSITLTDPLKVDTDGDGCMDGAEDFNQDGIVDTAAGETNPRLAGDCGAAVNPDSDNDGIPNRLEDKNNNGVVDPGETDPNNPDTDGDGIKDGIEDKNRNGYFEFGETDPLKKDTDCDGLIDGPSNAAMGWIGEDKNANGTVDATETDPTKKDSDLDGISDGIELGLTAANVVGLTGCAPYVFDADPATKTDPTKKDTDGDGIDDGAEDTNQNGKVDPGELNPNDPADGVGPAGDACKAGNLRPVDFRQELAPDLQLGLPQGYTEVRQMIVGGTVRGLIGYNPTQNAAFIAWRQAAPGASTTPTGDEAALRATMNGLFGGGSMTYSNTQTFTAWDNLPALKANYEQNGTLDTKSHINALANALVGAGAGALVGAGGAVGPFSMEAEYVHRTNAAVVVVLALTSKASYVMQGPPLFTVTDTAGGSAVAQFGDGNAVQCEVFTPGASDVDFLFVVDDSCSMATSQLALASAANSMATQLAATQLNWRVGLVTTDYRNGNAPIFHHFTNTAAELRAWLTQNSVCTAAVCTNLTAPVATPICNPGGGPNGGCWIGTGGSGTEAMLSSVARAVDFVSTAANPADQKVRAGAKLVIVALGDADDQSTATAAQFITFFGNLNATLAVDGRTYTNRFGAIPVHGIICPTGYNCNAEPNANKHGLVIAGTGGVRGNLCAIPAAGTDANCASYANVPTDVTAILNSVVAAAGYRMQKPPIGASVKVAMSQVLSATNCPNKADLPRSFQHGFNFDGINRSLALFGDCRPPAAGVTTAAVSYRYWIDYTPNPGGNPPPCLNDAYYDPTQADFCRGKLACNLATNICECPANCGGGGPPNQVCNPNRAVCDFVCTADCNGMCSGYQTCNTGSCACECLQTASCAVGYRFQNGAGVCGCVCDTTALNCGAAYNPDATSCSCQCKADCGGCTGGTTCNPSTCTCGTGIN